MRSDAPPAPAGGQAVPWHTAQLYDDDRSLVDSVAAYAADGWRRGETLLFVTTATHWAAIERRLEALGIEVGDAVGTGRLMVRDAREMLALLRCHERIDAARFDAHVADLVRTLAARGPRVRVFGEMVDLLAGAGDFTYAEQLEALWDRLAGRLPLQLLCGYSAVTFGDPCSRDALRRICRAHEHVHTDPADVLGSFLVDRALHG